MKLFDLQRQFRDVLFQKKQGSLPIHEKSITVNQRLFVYQNNLYQSLYKNLSDKFKMTKQYLGEERFFPLAQAYIMECPQKSPSLCEYGEGFWQGVSGKIEKELAELEWHMNRSLISYQKKDPLQYEELIKMPPHLMSDLILHLHTSLHLYVAAYDLKDVWMTLKEGRKKPTYKKKSYFLITSENQKSFFLSLEKEEYFFLEAMRKGQSLGEIFILLSDIQSFEKMLHKFIPYCIGFQSKSI